jgi:streptomycin 6-kinase
LPLIEVPEALAAAYRKYEGDAGAAWITALPNLAAGFLDQWRLRLDGEPAHGVASLVLPVIQAGDTPAALKLQLVNKETIGEPIGLRAWNGDGAVRLLDEDPDSGTMLLERLDASRPLSTVQDDMAAVRVLAELLSRLVAIPAPAGIRRLSDIARAMVQRTPRAVRALRDTHDRRLLETCASAVRELLDEPGDRLLHWDLHYDNILAGDREPWLAIDPKPLAGDPGFDLLPALTNRWNDIVATGDIPRAVRRRFDLMTEILGLERKRAIGWTLGRVLQNGLWDIGDGESALQPKLTAIARTLLAI